MSYPDGDFDENCDENTGISASSLIALDSTTGVAILNKGITTTIGEIMYAEIDIIANVPAYTSNPSSNYSATIAYKKIADITTSPPLTRIKDDVSYFTESVSISLLEKGDHDAIAFIALKSF